MKKRLMALLLATTVIASGCGAEDEPDEKDVEVSGSEEKSDEDSEDDNSVSDSDTEVSDSGIKLEGKYTDGEITYIFSGDEFRSSDIYTVKYKIVDDELIMDVNTLELTDKFKDYYEQYSHKFSGDIDEIIEVYKTKWEDPCKIEYDEKNNTLTFKDNTYYYAENYDLGPSGVYTCEDNENITITFEDGEVTYDKDGYIENFSYNCFIKDDKVCISFYDLDLNEREFYYKYHTIVVEDVGVDEVVLEPDTFKK